MNSVLDFIKSNRWLVIFSLIFVSSSIALAWIWLGDKAQAEASSRTIAPEALAALESIQKENDALVTQLSDLKDELAAINEKAGGAAMAEASDPATAAPASSSGAKATASASQKVNLNSADSTRLQTLPGIGPSKAQAILDYRKGKGSFKSTKELLNVKGIGEKTYAKLAPLVTVE